MTARIKNGMPWAATLALSLITVAVDLLHRQHEAEAQRRCEELLVAQQERATEEQRQALKAMFERMKEAIQMERAAR